MCGIAGIIYSKEISVNQRDLTRMVNCLRHRGPDGQGIFSEGPVGLAHVHLAIVEPEEATNQPLVDSSGRYVLVYAGEVYNHRELRVELETLGYSFKTHGDAEVVINGIIEWGENALVRFNGMFSLAFLDQKSRELILARDRCGIKPLYYYNRNSTVLFGSEIKAILSHPESIRELDSKALYEYLTFQNYLSNRTLFRGVKLLPPGTVMTISMDRGILRSHKYWDFDFVEPGKRRSIEDYADELDHLLRRAIFSQLESKTEVATHLSGGVDSGTITAIAASRVPDMKTFTIGFDTSNAAKRERDVDERHIARRMAQLFGTRHHERVVFPHEMEQAMEKIIWHLEEPRVGQVYANHFLAKLASRHCRAIFSGVGGDEMFAGYPWRYQQTAGHSEDFVKRLLSSWQRLAPENVVRDLLTPVSSDLNGIQPGDLFRDLLGELPSGRLQPETALHIALGFEARTFLNGLLVVEDKLGLAVGMETRFPFLDNDLLAFAQRLPASVKIRDLVPDRLEENPNYRTKPPTGGKILLRKVLERYAPRSISMRAKRGFSGPDSSWYRHESSNYVLQRLGNRNAKLFEFLDYEITLSKVNAHLQGSENNHQLIWSLLSLERWCENFLP